MGLAGVILAAGESTRMGRDKALLPWPPEENPSKAGLGTLLSYNIEALNRVCDLVIVVAGNNETVLQSIVDASAGFLVRNPHPELGQFSSLQVGLRDVLNRGREAAMITLVDRPAPRTETLQELVDRFLGRSHEIWAVVPSCQGKHGHPIVIAREMIEAFLRAPASSAARDIEHANQQRILYVPADDPAVVVNINTPEQYASLK
jgi:molybdenum cofactor cytidylyltransferase